MPTSQGHQEDEMPSVKESHCAWHTVTVTAILSFLLSSILHVNIVFWHLAVVPKNDCISKLMFQVSQRQSVMLVSGSGDVHW